MTSIEPIIIHEMSHAFVVHLPIPVWLNEGLAVNVERRLSPSHEFGYTFAVAEALAEKHEKLLQFWTISKIQKFWSGESFSEIGEGSSLSYDLARIMVEHLSEDWPKFRSFVLSANHHDAGAAAAHEHLGMDLGAFVCAILGKEETAGWAPDPSAW